MKPSFPLLKALLGSNYERFVQAVLAAEIAKLPKIKQETLEKITLALSKGEVPVTEELLDHQTRTARNGGAFIEAAMHLPDGLTPKTFVKVFSSRKDFDIEARVTKELHEAGSPYVLPPRFVAQPKWWQFFTAPSLVLATPFVEGERVYDLYRKPDAPKAQLIEECADALLDTYERMKDKQIHPLAGKEASLTTVAEEIALQRIFGRVPKIKEFLESYKTIEQRLKKAPRAFLHGDPNLSNFIKGEKLYLVDWEFAREGIIHSDLYRLFLRSDLSEEAKQEILKKIHERMQGYEGTLKEFYDEYKACEIHEHLITAGQFKHLSRTNPLFEQAANLYYTKAVRGARELSKKNPQDIELLRLYYALITLPDAEIRILQEEEYQKAEEETRKHGPSTIFAQSIDGDTAKKDVVKVLERKQKARRWGKASAMIGATGLAAIMGLGEAKEESKEPKPAEYYSIEQFLDAGWSTEYDKHPAIQGLKAERHWLTYPFSDREKIAKANIPFEDYVRLLWGEPKKLPDGKDFADGNSLSYRLAKKYGIPDYVLTAIFYTNAFVKFDQERDAITGLPKKVLKELGQNSTLEEKAELAAQHLRTTLEMHKFKLFESTAFYYCGSNVVYDAMYRANEERRKQNPQAETAEFWDYCNYLPDNLKKTVMQAVLNENQGWNDAYMDVGMQWPDRWEKNLKIQDKYKVTSTAQQQAKQDN